MEHTDEAEEQTGVSVHTGFPNPAADKSLAGLDLNRLLIHNTASTFLFRLRGSEWGELGIFDGDIAIVDRAWDARQEDLVIGGANTPRISPFQNKKT